MKKLLLCLPLFMMFSWTQAQLVDIEIEAYVVHPPEDYADGVNLDGYTTYRMWAVCENTDDFVSSMFGVEDVITQINTSTTFWNSSFGGPTAENISEAAIGIVPSLAYDTYVTVGKVFASDPGQPVFTAGTDWINAMDPGAGADGGSFILEGEIGGAWFTVNLGEIDSENGYAGDDFKVLVGQFTTDGVFTGCVNVQVFPHGVGTDAVETEICFGASFGCTDSTAINYDSTAEEDDGSCLYPCALEIDELTFTNPSCFGDSDGAISVTVTGDQQFTDFQLDDGALIAVGNFTGLDAGDYTITVYDAVCEVTVDVTLEDSPEIVFDVSIFNDISCAGDTDGHIAGTASGGTGVLNFDLADDFANAGTSINFTDLLPGDYVVYAIDENDCTANTEVFSLNDPAPLMISVTNDADASCFDSEDGVLVMSASGGTGDVDYSTNGVDYQEGNVINTAPAGMVTVYGMDESGCISTIDFEVGAPDEMIVGATITSASCNGICDAFVQATISGGNGQWNFSLDGGDLINTGQWDDVCAGEYELYAIDWLGCEDTVTITVMEPEVLAATADATDILCFGDDNGSIDVDVTGGTMDYTYAIDCTTFATDDVFSDLEAGSYTICVVDANGCTTEVSADIAEPDALSIDSVTATNETQAGGDGSIDSEVSGGTGDYTYEWTDGNGNVVSTDADPTDLGAGCYTLTVTDENGCSATDDTACIDTQIGDLDSSISFSVYPNPTQGILNLNIQGLTDVKVAYTLTDARGRVVAGEELNVLGGEYMHTININDTSNGVYFLTLTVGQSQRTVKVVKQF